ncbi:VIT family [Geosmithia morbida]|uniref:VIT family n=1 Tax=Geosmithia morbida TaxID=1094350 RepID=A0A9P5D1J1_9HYPO|nr:VIT family [Geosmithia morbida]KAF4119885.1 VIT family [Geosmithia morbida]
MTSYPRQNKLLALFLADYTLGFSDGLTVPFALTAGLSSLGRTDTVIYAGLAELCAGSISMGIGGYLSALDAAKAQTNGNSRHGSSIGSDVDEEEARGMLPAVNKPSWPTGGRRGSLGSLDSQSSSVLFQDDKVMYTGVSVDNSATNDAVENHLAPLDLPSDLVLHIISTLRQRQGTSQASQALALHRQRRDRPQRPRGKEDDEPADNVALSPLTSGLSIALGYSVGGLIPLLPYLFMSTIGSALWWSAALCLAALFLFGFGKSWLLGDGGEEYRGRLRKASYAMRWRQGLWEGFMMLILGSMAAGAAVLCVNLAEGAGHEGPPLPVGP